MFPTQVGMNRDIAKHCHRDQAEMFPTQVGMNRTGTCFAIALSGFPKRVLKSWMFPTQVGMNRFDMNWQSALCKAVDRMFPTQVGMNRSHPSITAKR